MPLHQKRERDALKRKQDKKVVKKRKREQALRADKLGLSVEKKVPRTIENTREKDETLVEAGDPILEADEAFDEFASYFQHQSTPKLLLTTCYRPSKIMYRFLVDMLEVLTNAHYYKRQRYPIKKLVEYATERDFTDLLIFNEDRKDLNGLLLVHLPNGPTAHFKLSNVVLCKDIKGHGRPTRHKPELILNHFNTQLGRRLGRMIACMFSPAPAFRGRQVATFHNQRDYIFFRHHRYIFDKKERKTKEGEKEAGVVSRLQELGPRFTLRLRSLQKGTFDSKCGEFEWMRKPELGKSRRKFAL